MRDVRLAWKAAPATCSGGGAWWSQEAQSRPLATHYCGRVPLNHGQGRRFFEVMAAGVPQVVFGDPGLVGEHRHLAERPDVFWASSLEQLEALVLQLLADPERLRAIPVAPPPYWELKDLLKAVLAP